MVGVLLFLIIFFSAIQCDAYNYSPPKGDSSGVKNKIVIDQPFELVWQLAQSVMSSQIILKDEPSGIIQTAVKGTRDDLINCGKVPDPGKGKRPFNYPPSTDVYRVYPEQILYELKMERVSNSQTAVSVEQKETKGKWIAKLSVMEYSLGDKLKARCISTGKYERSVLDGMQRELDSLQKLKKDIEKRKIQEAEEERKKQEIVKQKKQEEENELKRKEEQRQAKVKEESARKLKWQGAGFTQKEMEKWLGQGVDLPTAKVLKPKCPKGLGDLEDLLNNNAYDFTGKCYHFTGKSIQTLSRTEGLFEGPRLSLLDFAPDSAPNMFFQGYVKGVGVYKYTTIRGDLQIVPHFKVIRVPKDKE